jgi:hypothetical protein
VPWLLLIGPLKEMPLLEDLKLKKKEDINGKSQLYI